MASAIQERNEKGLLLTERFVYSWVLHDIGESLVLMLNIHYNDIFVLKILKILLHSNYKYKLKIN